MRYLLKREENLVHFKTHIAIFEYQIVLECEDYGKAVYQEEDSQVLTAIAEKTKTSTCGIVEVPLVVGGTDAESKEFPHMVSEYKISVSDNYVFQVNEKQQKYDS